MDDDPDDRYEVLAGIEPALDRPATEVIDHIGRLIDAAARAGQAAGAKHAVSLCERLRKEARLRDDESTLLSYFEANAWSVLRPSPASSHGDAWNWTDKAFRNEILRLRQAQRSPGFVQLHPLRQSEIH